MAKYFVNGRLTVRAALYLSAFCISLVMGFSAPLTVNYFISHVTPTLIASLGIVLKLVGILVSYIKQSKIAIRYISQNFMTGMIICDILFLILAIFGEANPEMRYVGYNLICAGGIKLLQVVRHDNTANCLKGTSIIAFNAKCDTCGLIANLLGASCYLVISNMVILSVTQCMFIECIGCAFGHWMQLYANRRIKKDILKNKLPEYTMIDVLNDLVRVKNNKVEDKEDNIFDQ